MLESLDSLSDQLYIQREKTLEKKTVAYVPNRWSAFVIVIVQWHACGQVENLSQIY